MWLTMKKTIGDLIKNYEWPGINAITFGDGKMILLYVELYPEKKYHIAPITDSSIDSYLGYNLDNLSPFDVFSKAEYSNCEVLVGDASGEGNGVIYVVDKVSNSLVWFAFFENSEPFKSVSINKEGVINAKSASEVIWKIPIKNPLQIELFFP